MFKQHKLTMVRIAKYGTQSGVNSAAKTCSYKGLQVDKHADGSYTITSATGATCEIGYIPNLQRVFIDTQDANLKALLVLCLGFNM